MTRDQVRAALVEWLESERNRYLVLADSRGIALSVPIVEQVVTDLQETSVQYTERQRFVSPFQFFTAESSMLAMAQHEKGGAPEPPLILYDHYGEKCRMWTGILFPPSRGPKDDAAGLMTRTATDYLSQLESLDKPNTQLASALVDGLLQLVEADHVLFVMSLPVAGLRLNAERLDFDQITVRRLTHEEIGSLLEPFRTQRRVGRPIALLFPDVVLERCLLVVRAACPKTEQPRSHRAQAVALAIQLLGFPLRGRGEGVTYTEPGPSLWSGGGPVPLEGHGGEIRDFKQEDLESVAELAKQIPDEVFSGPTKRSTIALHRFRSAQSEVFPGDALLDFVTALEALLLSENDELSFRLALYGARYLANDPPERRRIFGELRKVYRTRSKLVHGSGGLRDVRELEELRKSAHDLARRILLKAIRNGWPTRDELEELSLL